MDKQFPKSTRMKSLVVGVLIAVGVGVTTVEASRMSKLFDSYSVGASYSDSSGDGMRWTGGSFQGRWKQPDIQLFSFQPPSINAGCGGIDVFAGSFGMVSSDQLVQVARGLAQGAAYYLFKLSINSICASCSSIMADIQSILEKFNSMAKDSCARGQQLAAAAFQSDTPATESDWSSNIASVTSSWNASLGNADFVEGLLDGMAADKGAASPSAAAVIDGNSVFQALQRTKINDLGLIDSLSKTFPGADDRLRYTSFLMTLLGYQLGYQLSEGEQCDSSTAPWSPGDDTLPFCLQGKGVGLTFRDLVQGDTANADNKVVFTQYSCAGNIHDECLSVNEEPNQTIEPLSVFAKRVLSGNPDKNERGLFDLLWAKDNLESHHIRFLQLMPIPHVRIKQMIDRLQLNGSSFENYYAALFAYEVAKNLRDSINQIDATVQRIAKRRDNVDFLKQFNASLTAFNQDADRVLVDLEKKLREAEESLKIGLQMVELRKLIQLGE